MGVYVKGNPKEGEYKLIKTTDGFVLEGKDIAYACIEIDLVKCGECKHMRKYALRSDEPTGIWCHRWSVPRLVTDDDFCSYGERRAE